MSKIDWIDHSRSFFESEANRGPWPIFDKVPLKTENAFFVPFFDEIFVNYPHSFYFSSKNKKNCFFKNFLIHISSFFVFFLFSFGFTLDDPPFWLFHRYDIYYYIAFFIAEIPSQFSITLLGKLFFPV